MALTYVSFKTGDGGAWEFLRRGQMLLSPISDRVAGRVGSGKSHTGAEKCTVASVRYC